MIRLKKVKSLFKTKRLKKENNASKVKLGRKRENLKKIENGSNIAYCSENPKRKKCVKQSTKHFQTSKVFTCKICLQTFSDEKILQTHRKTEHIIKDFEESASHYYDEFQDLYICEVCSAEFQTKTEADSHINIHLKILTCRICESKFTSYFELGLHSSEHSKGGEISCPQCSYVTSNKYLFKTHLNERHLHIFLFYCSWCGKGFNRHNKLQLHMSSHEGEKSAVCIVCSSKYSREKALRNHQILKHHAGIFGQGNECLKCNIYFYITKARIKHEEKCILKVKKKKEKKFLCSYCGHGFKRRFEMVDHIRVHTGEKPFVCSYCGKSFNKRELLKNHTRVHTGEKPYSCEFCGKRFGQRTPFKVHLRTHTGERPYVCAFCKKGFTTNQGLKSHLKNCEAVDSFKSELHY